MLDLQRNKDQLKSILDRLIVQLNSREDVVIANNNMRTEVVDKDNSNQSTSTVKFQRQKVPLVEKDLLTMDLNKCSDVTTNSCIITIILYYY